MTDQKTLAYINMYAVLGGLTVLCDIAPEAQKILSGSGCSIGFAVKNGPEATLTFIGKKCIIKPGTANCAIRIPFSSPEKFNRMINGEAIPIPTKGFTKLTFLLGKFKKLTDLLEKYLRPTEEMLEDETFRRRSTLIMFRVVVAAISQIANNDPIGQASAAYIIDGPIKLEIPGVTKACLLAKDHHLTYSDKVPTNFMSYMQFADIDTARALFDGKINSVAAVGEGLVRVGGMVSQIDNVNRILSRVELYLR